MRFEADINCYSNKRVIYNIPVLILTLVVLLVRLGLHLAKWSLVAVEVFYDVLLAALWGLSTVYNLFSDMLPDHLQSWTLGLQLKGGTIMAEPTPCRLVDSAAFAFAILAT